MNLLAFDTSTETMSIAVSRTRAHGAQTWQHTAAGGAQASTGLIAGVLDLMAQADLEVSALHAICFGSGPGSFTGLRTACSVAQGLAFGAGVPVLPVPSLLAVAEEARYAALADEAAIEVIALLDARMDEMYLAVYAYAHGVWTERQTSVLARPEDLAVAANATVLAGNVFEAYGDRLQSCAGFATARHITTLPTASAMLRLAPQLLNDGKAVPAHLALPLYVRDKVAKTTLERAAEKAAAHAN